MVVKYMHHGDDLVEHRTREASFGAQCTNHSANSMCSILLSSCYMTPGGTMVRDIAIGAVGLGFDSQAGQVGRSVVISSPPPIGRFFGAGLPRR